ncbi:hypothetical protein [Nocardia sp. NPDC047648]|uniref:hypothetical protein n=1 Tax=Nocardia sp. NPDC047648 TaxID=3155625 RepID=UPI0033DEF1BE
MCTQVLGDGWAVAEGSARTGEHEHARGLVGFELVDGGLDGLRGGQVDRVARFGTVDRQHNLVLGDA